jgi:transcriptional regulator with XRE-family HTH domain
MDAMAKIEKLLRAKGWKQNAFEKAAVLAENRLSKWKDGQGEPTLRQASRMARLLGVPLEYLADDELEDPPAGPGLTDDERAILDLYRALGLDRAEGLRRLATPSAPGGQMAAGPARPSSPREGTGPETGERRPGRRTKGRGQG